MPLGRSVQPTLSSGASTKRKACEWHQKWKKKVSTFPSLECGVTRKTRSRLRRNRSGRTISLRSQDFLAEEIAEARRRVGASQRTNRQIEKQKQRVDVSGKAIAHDSARRV